MARGRLLLAQLDRALGAWHFPAAPVARAEVRAPLGLGLDVTSLSSGGGSDSPRPSDAAEDLQHVDDETLAEAKAKMDVVFQQHRLRPGDPGYVYDKREDFGEPTEANEWDE
jgi:hypothetical protein